MPTNSPSASPPGPPGYPLLGSLPDIRRDVLGFFVDTTRQYGDFVQFRFLRWKAFIANHPDYIKHVLQDNNRNYNKQHFDYQSLRILLGDGLLTSDGETWLRQRRLIQPAFHRHRVQAIGDLMSQAAEEMVQRWERRTDPGTPLDISEEMMRLTLTIVGRALFSLDLSGEAETVGRSFTFLNRELSARFRSLLSLPLSIPTPRNRTFIAARRQLDQVVAGVIRSRRQSEGDAQPDDLLSMLLAARDEETGRGMPDTQLRDEVMTLLLAGHETTANALSWTWYLLSEHPEVEGRLHQELNSVLGDRAPAVSDLPRLPYTRMIIQESLRLYPPAWIISRMAEQDDEIGGYHVPAGSVVEMCSFATHRHPGLWENPSVFDPERFSPERSTARPAYAYYPFGGGPRLCIGRDFALLEAQLILAAVARCYKLELVPGHPVRPEPLITLRPKHGLLMFARPRSR